MVTAVDAIRAEFSGIVGEAQVACDERVCAEMCIDGKVPGWVVYPASAEQVVQTLKCAAEHNLAVVPVGSGTKLAVGNPPRRYDIALCLQKLNGVQHYEPADLTVGVDAGMKFEDFQDLIHRDGLWLPLDPPGGGQGTVGGIAATNAAGPLRHLYGAPRDMILGMKVATTEGKLIKTGGRVVKNVAGYDLGKLMIGSFGTLGVIVEVNFKLYPLPAQRQTFVFSTGTLGIGRELRRSIMNSPIDPMRMVLLDAEAAGLLRPGAASGTKAHGPEIWIEAAGSKAVMDRTRKELETQGRAVGAKVRSMEEESAQAAWQRVSDFALWLRQNQPGTVVLKATMPIVNTEEFLSLAQQEAESEKIKLASVTQVGVGMALLGLLESENARETAGLMMRLRKSAEEFGGALTVVSCSAGLKKQLDVWGAPGDSLALMKRIKSTWDPKSILAPGRFVGSI